MKIVSGVEAKNLIESQIKLYEADLSIKLSIFEPTSSTAIWLNTIRSIEELINLPFSIDENFIKTAPIFSVELRRFTTEPQLFKILKSAITPHIYPASVNRILNLIVQSIAIGWSFEMQGINNAIKMDSDVFELINYYQSRRRHIVSLFYCLPHYCKGQKIISEIDSINHFLPFVEYNCNQIYGYQIKLILSDIYADFHMQLNEVGGTANYDYQSLEQFFLEPERLGITELNINEKEIDGLESFDRKSIFSSEELRNSVLIIKHAYKEFLLEGDEFSKFGELVNQLTRWCVDGFNISLDELTFKTLMRNFSFDESIISKFIIAYDNYSQNSNAVAPFIKIGSKYITTTMLLNRFLYFHKNRILGRSKRFKIRTGFIFEDNVKLILKDHGFDVADVKRINRREFDVIVKIGSGILNIQCKNNSIDLADVSSNPNVFVRYNRLLERYYERALKKELAREQLIFEKFSCDTVAHVVLSKFPIISKNRSIINFRDFKLFISNISNNAE